MHISDMPTPAQELAAVERRRPDWALHTSPDTATVWATSRIPPAFSIRAATAAHVDYRIAGWEHTQPYRTMTRAPGVPMRTCPVCGYFAPHYCTGPRP